MLMGVAAVVPLATAPPREQVPLIPSGLTVLLDNPIKMIKIKPTCSRFSIH